MNSDAFCRMLALLQRLREAKIANSLPHDEALLIEVNVPGER